MSSGDHHLGSARRKRKEDSGGQNKKEHEGINEHNDVHLI
jgi:hypothetical protein